MNVRFINMAWRDFALEILRCLWMKHLRIIIKSISWASFGTILPHLPINYMFQLLVFYDLPIEVIFGRIMLSAGVAVVGPGDNSYNICSLR